MPIQEIKFRVRTPLFLGSAVQKENSIRHKGSEYKMSRRHIKLTTEAFRGTLRSWFRSVKGYPKDKEDRKEFFKEEGQLFGSTECGKGIGLQMLYEEDALNVLTHDENDSWKMGGRSYGYYEISRTDRYDRPIEVSYDGYGYFSHFMFAEIRPNRRHKKPGGFPRRDYIDVGSEFSIRVRAMKQEQLEKIMMLFWIAFQFGGIGAHSTRCFGNLDIVESESVKFLHYPEFNLNNVLTSSNPKEYANHIRHNFSIINKAFNPSPEPSKAAPEFRDIKLFISKEEKKEYFKAINHAGLSMQMFRSKAGPDYETMKYRITSNTESERLIFGAPIAFRNGRTLVNLNVIGPDGKESRHRSPVIASVLRVGENKYLAQYLILSFDYGSLAYKDFSSRRRIKGVSDTEGIRQFTDFLKNPDQRRLDQPFIHIPNDKLRSDELKFNEVAVNL